MPSNRETGANRSASTPAVVGITFSVTILVGTGYLDAALTALRGAIRSAAVVFAAATPGNKGKLTPTTLPGIPGGNDAAAELVLKNAVGSTLVDEAAAVSLRKLRERLRGVVKAESCYGGGVSQSYDLNAVLTAMALTKGSAAVFLDVTADELTFPALLDRLGDDVMLGSVSISVTKAGRRLFDDTWTLGSGETARAELSRMLGFRKVSQERVADIEALIADIDVRSGRHVRIPLAKQTPYLARGDGLY